MVRVYEPLGLYRDYIWVNLGLHWVILGLYRIMENKMETTIVGL